SRNHGSGTERIAEVVANRVYPDDTIIVNLQGDAPQMSPSLLDQTAQALKDHREADVSTLCERIDDKEVLFDSNRVKVVLDNKGYALYFSRAPIPWAQTDFDDRSRSIALPKDAIFYHHIGIYGYRAGFLKYFVALSPCQLEHTEGLEQLRILFNGGKIYVEEARESPGWAVDTEGDLEKVRSLFRTKASR
ncbi:MAG: 3-deoxy-manno-octulosonate cytidylyltransferase, partial [Gammaproteobacteria bacterium]